MKKKLIAIFTAFVLSLSLANYAWSALPIELVVPTAPGGAVDTTARSISKELTEHGYENIVTYYPGANGELATQRVFEKRNNVIFVASMANFVFQDVALNRSNQLSTSMKLLGPTVTNSMAFFVSGNNETSTLNELIAIAKTKSQPCGVSNNHGEIILRQINKQYNTQFEPVMYKGTGKMLPDVIGGHLPCAFDQTAPYVAQGDRVRWLGTSDNIRIKSGVPTIATVLPGFYFVNWYASAVPVESNLLNDTKLINLLKNWSQNQILAKPLVDQGFIVSPADENLNTRAARETEFYLKLLKR